MSWIGHESFITMATPLALEAKELKKILGGECFWQSLSASLEVLVSWRRKIFDGDLFILL